MNIFKIISEIEKVDPEVYERLDSRRSIFKHMSGMGKTLAAAAVPLAFGSVLNKAYGQTAMAPSIADVVNFALRLEYLESYFYNAGLGTPGATATPAQTAFRALFSATNLSSLDKIRTDETNHVSFLRAAITQAGATPIPVPAVDTFDFTGGKGSMAGPFADVFVNPATFLAVAQALEDTGVRAYKGGAPYLASNDAVLEAALNIHSVEARHASRLRTMRRAGANDNTASRSTITGNDRGASPKSWVSGNDGGGPAPAQTAPIYAEAIAPSYTPSGITFPGEDNTTQATIDLTKLTGVSAFPPAAFSEAFDEPLPMPRVVEIASTFVVADNPFFA